MSDYRDNRDVRMMQVIRTRLTRRGEGTPESQHRVVTEYWSLKGELLATVDPLERAVYPESSPAEFTNDISRTAELLRAREQAAHWQKELNSLEEETDHLRDRAVTIKNLINIIAEMAKSIQPTFSKDVMYQELQKIAELTKANRE